MCDIDDEPYVPNEYTRYIPAKQWRKFNMGVPMTDRDPLLVEREKTHGSFETHAATTQKFKVILQSMPNWNGLSPRHKEALEMILHKIGRIAAGNPNWKDHWDDIAGYAKLGSEACE